MDFGMDQLELFYKLLQQKYPLRRDPKSLKKKKKLKNR